MKEPCCKIIFVVEPLESTAFVVGNQYWALLRLALGPSVKLDAESA